MEHYVLTLRCADQPGIVRALAEGVVRAKGNILESAQFSDPDRLVLHAHRASDQG